MRALWLLPGLVAGSVLAAGTPPPIDPTGCGTAASCSSQCNVWQTGNVTVLCLRGSHREMGLAYGRVLRSQLRSVLHILVQHYMAKEGYSYPQLAELTNAWHYRYSYRFQSFIEGMAEGAGLPLQDAKILNGMVVYGLLDDWNRCPGAPAGYPGSLPWDPPHDTRRSARARGAGLLGGCAFGFVPPARSATGRGFATRNYDFPKPFYDISRFLVTTILVEEDAVPTAFVSMPGQIYCQTCVNAAEIFMELNNGGPSSGFCIHPYRQGMLIDMLKYLQDSAGLWQLDYQLRKSLTDVGLIVGVADGGRAKAYELSPYTGSRTLVVDPGLPLVTTNFFQNSSWTAAETNPVGDNNTWNGFKRRNNILKAIEGTLSHTLETVKDLWVKGIDQGGAVWEDSIYQVVFDFSTGSLHLRQVKWGGLWVEVPLRAIFATATAEPLHSNGAKP